MSKYQYHMGVDVARGDDSTAFSYFRQRRIRWWEKIIMRVFKGYKIRQPLELIDTWAVPSKPKPGESK